MCPVGAELFHADGRTDKHDETNSGFPQFYERAKKTLSTVTKAPMFPLRHFRGTRCEYRAGHQLFCLRLFVTSLRLHTAPLSTS